MIGLLRIGAPARARAGNSRLHAKALSATLALGAALGAQSRSTLALANPTSSGSTSIPCSVWAPAASAFPAPWPVVSLLHGHGFEGREYDALGKGLARAGYLVVAPDNAKTDGWLQGLDALALPAALTAENARANSPLFGKVDVARRAVVGHSMGAANAVRVLAEDAGCLAGVAITPIFAPQSYATRVRAPLALVGAEGDSLTPWRTHLLGIRAQLPADLAAWTTTVWDASANHLNPVFRDFAGATAADDLVFDSTLAVVRAALGRWVGEEPGALDALVGRTARAAGPLSVLEHRFYEPEHFATTSASEYRLHVVGPDGPVLEFGAFATAQIPTPFGVLGLDPSSLLIAPPILASGGRVTTLVFPRAAQFRGLDVWFQSLSTSYARPYSLGRVLKGRLSDQ